MPISKRATLCIPLGDLYVIIINEILIKAKDNLIPPFNANDRYDFLWLALSSVSKHTNFINTGRPTQQACFPERYDNFVSYFSNTLFNW